MYYAAARRTARGGWSAQCSNVRANAKPLLVLGVINTLVTSGFTLALALTVAARALLLHPDGREARHSHTASHSSHLLCKV